MHLCSGLPVLLPTTPGTERSVNCVGHKVWGGCREEAGGGIPRRGQTQEAGLGRIMLGCSFLLGFRPPPEVAIYLTKIRSN